RPDPALHGPELSVGVLRRAPATAAAVALRRADRLGAAHGRALRGRARGLHAGAPLRRLPPARGDVRDADRLARADPRRAVRARLPRGRGGAAALARAGGRDAAAPARAQLR